MSNGTKIQLSKLENELVNNTEWILTKQAIINKIYLFFGELHEVYKKISAEEKNIISIFNHGERGKISKGENYLGLPYVILDYPGIFEKENVFAVRTMFWWGNFFSITLHISGLKINSALISKVITHLHGSDFFVCINDNEWQHSFDSANYIPVNKLNSKTASEISLRSFLKISKKIDLEKWEAAPEFLEKTYREVVDLIKINFPAGEKVL